MTLPKPTIVIFDMDGTTVRHLNPALLHVLEWLDDSLYRLGGIKRWLFDRNAEGPIFPDNDPENPGKRPRLLLRRALHRANRKPLDQVVEPCPGIYAVLDLIRAHGIPMALVSNGLGQGYGHEVLQTFDLEKYYRATVFREDINRSKPHPEPLMLALQQIDVKLKKSDVIWYIGDRHKDVIAATALGNHIDAKVVPIAYALNAAVAALKVGLGPENIIMSYFDIRKKLVELLGPAPKKNGGTGNRNKGVKTTSPAKKVKAKDKASTKKASSSSSRKTKAA